MVQYKSLSNESSNDYWKLEHGADLTIAEHKISLAKVGYYCPAKVNRALVTQVYSRYQRRLPPYGRYDVSTLRGFCQARGLLGTVTGPKSALVQALEIADEDATFERLFDLPREIRDMIYKFHCEDYPSMLHYHHQPPVTIASRQLRDETLPAFYKHCCFQFGMGWFFGAAAKKPELTQLTNNMVDGITVQNFAYMRHLSATVGVAGRVHRKLFHLAIRLDILPQVHPEDAVSVGCSQYHPRCPYGLPSSRWQPCDPGDTWRLAFTYCKREVEVALQSLLEEMQFKRRGFELPKDFATKFQEAVARGLNSARALINQSL